MNVNNAVVTMLLVRSWRVLWKYSGKSSLHRDGIFGVTGYIPAGILCGVRKERMRAWNIFFRLHGVDRVFGLATFVRDGQ